MPRESNVSVDENLSKTLERARETKDERLQRITARVIGENLHLELIELLGFLL